MSGIVQDPAAGRQGSLGRYRGVLDSFLAAAAGELEAQPESPGSGEESRDRDAVLCGVEAMRAYLGAQILWPGLR